MEIAINVFTSQAPRNFAVSNNLLLNDSGPRLSDLNISLLVHDEGNNNNSHSLKKWATIIVSCGLGFKAAWWCPYWIKARQDWSQGEVREERSKYQCCSLSLWPSESISIWNLKIKKIGSINVRTACASFLHPFTWFDLNINSSVFSYTQVTAVRCMIGGRMNASGRRRGCGPISWYFSFDWQSFVPCHLRKIIKKVVRTIVEFGDWNKNNIKKWA